MIKKIGAGAFGKIYLVLNTETDEKFVMKEVELDVKDKKSREQALAEARFLKQLKHPNIISVCEYFVEDDTLYMVMEYAEGGDMEELIKKQNGKPFPEDLVVDWLIQMCLSLKHIHDRKILHRDIKSSNIFLTKDNQIKVFSRTCLYGITLH